MRPGAPLFAIGIGTALFGAAGTVPSSTSAHAHAPPLVLLAPEPDAPALVRETVAWAEALPVLRFVNTHNKREDEVRLYGDDGRIDDTAASRLERVLRDDADGEDRPVMNRRLLQIIVKAAAHFHEKQVVVVSSWRPSKRSGSRHQTGEAIDFLMPSVASSKLAAYLRTLPRVGVGIYTHPRTRFVHLDVRDDSYHWADGSPPGRTWRESRLFDRTAIQRDRAYSPLQDLPF